MQPYLRIRNKAFGIFRRIRLKAACPSSMSFFSWVFWSSVKFFHIFLLWGPMSLPLGRANCLEADVLIGLCTIMQLKRYQSAQQNNLHLITKLSGTEEYHVEKTVKQISTPLITET